MYLTTHSIKRSAARKIVAALFFPILAFAVFFPRQALQAQFSCKGQLCSFLPLSQENLNSMLHEFKTQYTDVLFNDMGEAAVVANIAGPPLGTINLKGFTLGTNFAVAAVKPHDVNVQVPGTAEFQKIPASGGAISPRVYFGANLGQLIGMDYDPFSSSKSPSIFSLSRFALFLSYMENTETLQNNNNIQANVKGTVSLRGVELRYHLVEGGNILGGPLLRFHGVSLGIGMYTSRLHIEAEQKDSELGFNVEGVEMTWKGRNYISMNTRVDSYPIEIKTGIQFLYLLNLYLGAGVVSSKGAADFHMSRTGTVSVQTSLPLLQGLDIPPAELGIQIEGHGSVPARMAYFKAGVEFNLLWAKLTVEGIATKRTYGANFGVRVEL